jgi:hypothetical protein
MPKSSDAAPLSPSSHSFSIALRSSIAATIVEPPVTIAQAAIR